MPKKKTQSDRIEALEDRIEELAESIESHHGGSGGEEYDDVGATQFCANPPVPPREFAPDVSADRARAIVSIGRKWVNGTELHYYMFDRGIFGGAADQRQVVRDAFNVWKSVGIGLKFTEVTEIDDSELRIGFQHGDGSWSTVGTDALTRVGQRERTMNFGWDITVQGRNGLDTAVHEVGHAIGLNHEHQNPNAGIVWNEEAVYDYFARTQNPPWSRATTDHNILNKIDPSTVGGSDWDPDSVMHYSIARGLIREPARYRGGLQPAGGLSDKDEQVARQFYPDTRTNVAPELKLFRSEALSLAPGEQKDFNVLPTSSRRYNFSTFGASDTVMVLFEELDDGSFVYVQGDDDSGWDRNAAFRVRLIKDRKYQLRIRLYYQNAGGDTAVMMW